MEAFKKISGKAQPTLYVIFRVLVGFMFMLHGMQKLGMLGGNAMTGLFMAVGIGELLVGLGILTGFFTRLSALGGIVIMGTAFFWKHLGWNPLETKGEPALLFLAAFLVLFAMGAGKLSLEKALFKKEIF